MITDEDLEVLRKRIWEKSKEDITKRVEELLVSELRAHYHSDLKRFINAEVRTMIKPMIEVKRTEIEAKLHLLVNRIAETSRSVVEEEVMEMLKRSSDEVFSKIREIQSNWGWSIGNKIRTKLLESLKEEERQNKGDKQ